MNSPFGMCFKALVLCMLVAMMHPEAAASLSGNTPSDASGFTTLPDTLFVTTHNRSVVVTDPSRGVCDHRGWGVFPDPKTPVRRINMYVTFGCPDTMRCADWDYSDRIQLERGGGVEGERHNMELARLITPYGGFYRRDWTFTWEVDVTDFSLLLRDSIEVNFIHSGYEPNHDRGWVVTITFEVITGLPVADPIHITTLWDDGFVYGDPDHPIGETLLPVDWKADPQAHLARLRIVQTGHGMDSPDNCAEFCNRYREIWFDGTLWERRQLWKRCGWNPVFPQAGTWIFDRGNWCPGEIVAPELHHLPVKGGGSHKLQMVVESYNATEQNHGAQVISAYLIQYRMPHARHDATLMDVVVPSDKEIHSRRNPAVARPVIRVMNSGSDTLRSLRIAYGTKGYELHSIVWQGAIPPMQHQEVTLDGNILPGKGDVHLFVVNLEDPNGHSDEYPSDNALTIPFSPPPTHGSTLVFSLLTNNQPEQNGWQLVAADGTVIIARDTGTMAPATQYLDTFRLEHGGYTLMFTDTGGDGLEFWWNSRGGRGEARLTDGKGMLLRSFDPDFGSGWNYSFRVGDNPDTADQGAHDISVYPVRSHGETTLRYFANTPADVVITIITDPGGEVVEEKFTTSLKEGAFAFDLTSQPYGRFYVVVTANGREIYKRRIRYVDPAG